jgi:hypothetical protein
MLRGDLLTQTRRHCDSNVLRAVLCRGARGLDRAASSFADAFGAGSATLSLPPDGDDESASHSARDSAAGQCHLIIEGRLVQHQWRKGCRGRLARFVGRRNCRDSGTQREW